MLQLEKFIYINHWNAALTFIRWASEYLQGDSIASVGSSWKIQQGYSSASFEFQDPVLAEQKDMSCRLICSGQFEME